MLLFFCTQLFFEMNKYSSSYFGRAVDAEHASSEEIKVIRDKSRFPQDKVLPLLENNTSMNREDLLIGIVDSFPGKKIIADPEGEILWSKLSIDEDEVCHFDTDLIHKNIQELFPDFIYEGVSTIIQEAFKQNNQQSFEYPMMGTDGNQHFFLIKVNPIGEDKVFINIQNITRKKIAEEELISQAKELEQNHRQLKKTQASNEQLENFAYIASHDLREPLRTINNFADLLHRNYKDKLDEDGQTYLHFIVDRSQQMSYLIDDLLTYSRVNTENHNIEDVKFDELIDDVQLSLMQVINESKATIKRENYLPQPGMFKGNPVKMKQLFQNLIANAIKFRKKDIPCEITVRAKDAEGEWRFDVIDNGIGIRKEFQRQIFVLFKKLHATSSYPGTGLGLAICKKIIEQHNGNIWVDSEPDKGSTFSFTIKKDLRS